MTGVQLPSVDVIALNGTSYDDVAAVDVRIALTLYLKKAAKSSAA